MENWATGEHPDIVERTRTLKAASRRIKFQLSRELHRSGFFMGKTFSSQGCGGIESTHTVRPLEGMSVSVRIS